MAVILFRPQGVSKGSVCFFRKRMPTMRKMLLLDLICKVGLNRNFYNMGCLRKIRLRSRLKCKHDYTKYDKPIKFVLKGVRGWPACCIILPLTCETPSCFSANFFYLLWRANDSKWAPKYHITWFDRQIMVEWSIAIVATRPSRALYMMTSSNGNIFRVTGHLCGKFTGPRWISRTKASDAELWCFLWFTSE